MMLKTIIPFVFILLLLSACKDKNITDKTHGHDHDQGNTHAHGASTTELEPLAYTIYTEKTELFVEFKPLIVGETSKFAAHFTSLGANFRPVNEGSVTVSLVGNQKQPEHTSNQPSSPGIFRLNLTPKFAGSYKLLFHIKTKDYSDTIIIDHLNVYPEIKYALSAIKQPSIGDEIVYLKEQAWQIDFATEAIKKQKFSEIIKTTGQILTDQADEIILTAKNSGILTYANNKKLIGSTVKPGETLFTISGSSIINDNLDFQYKKAKTNYEKTKVDYDRASKLIVDSIISQKEFQDIQLRYNNAKTTYQNISKSYTSGGQKITSNKLGYIKNIYVNEGQYVEVGQRLARISQNKNLILQAEVPQKYFSKLQHITSANFKMAYDDKMHNTDELNGELISYGKHANNSAYYIPVNIKFKNQGNIIPGSFAEIFLKTSEYENALVIPNTAIIEEQGNYFAYVQTSGEGFQKRSLKLGGNNGFSVEVLSGLIESERIVTKGAYQIKLATMSGKMPAHGHEH